jgi:CheY-like chemotaxis protein
VSKHHLLLVDDEEPNRLLLGRRLTQQGYAVTAVEGGLAALEALRTTAIDLVLLDLLMPDMDGLATLDAIRIKPDYDHIPVLMLTASTLRESVVHCLSLGAADYVIKPVDPTQLFYRVRRQLATKSVGNKA